MERYLEFVLNHYILSLALAVVTYLLIQEFFDTAFKRYTSISSLLAVSKMNDEDTMIIDVRDPADFVTKHIEQAINMPLNTLADNLVKLGDHKEKPLLVACQDGIRSGSAAKMLTKAGFQQVFVIIGGINAWEDEYKLPVKISTKNKSKSKITS